MTGTILDIDCKYKSMGGGKIGNITISACMHRTAADSFIFSNIKRLQGEIIYELGFLSMSLVV